MTTIRIFEDARCAGPFRGPQLGRARRPRFWRFCQLASSAADGVLALSDMACRACVQPDCTSVPRAIKIKAFGHWSAQLFAARRGRRLSTYTSGPSRSAFAAAAPTNGPATR